MAKRALPVVQSNPTAPATHDAFRAHLARLADLRAEIELEPLPTAVRLSGNSKTGWSINAPLSECEPTAECSRVCYVLNSPMGRFPDSLRVMLRNQRLFDSLEHADQSAVDAVAYGLAHDCRRARVDFLRWNGSGDLSPGAVRVVNALLRIMPDMPIWCISRKPSVIEQLSDAPSLRLQISIDRTTAPSRRDALQRAAKRFDRAAVKFAYTRTSEDAPAPDFIAVTFNYHKGSKRSSWGPDATACAATVPVSEGGAAHDNACASCRRCFAPRV